MASLPNQVDARSEPREEVLHRTRATLPDGSLLRLTLVDLSPGGFMARSEAAVSTGDHLSVELPLVPRAGAEIRWALGGRIGCRFDRPLPADVFAELLRTVRR